MSRRQQGEHRAACAQHISRVPEPHLPIPSELPVFAATRNVQPLREGGSLPAIVDTRRGGLFVVKFRGAGQGAKALVAEVIVGGLAAIAGLPVPEEMARIDIAPAFGQSEPDPEIQELLRASHGVNFGLRYLDGAFNFDGAAPGEMVSSQLASRIVWLDAWLTNPDRTHRDVIQSGPVHEGVCESPEEVLDELFERIVRL